MVILFTIWSAARNMNFFQTSTMTNILRGIILSAFLAIGSGCLLISGNMDLSTASVGAFGGMIVATSIATWQMPWFVGILIALLFCACLGALNGFMVIKFRFPPFIATLAMTSIAKGLMYIFSSAGSSTGKAQNVQVLDATIGFIGKGSIGPVPFGIVVMLVFFLVYGIIISKSKVGMKIMMLGGNPTAATLAGIKANRLIFVLFVNSAVLGGVAGVFNTSRLGQGNLQALQNNQFTGITAAILGGISFGGGAGGMGGAFVGLLVLTTFQIGMSTVGLNPFWVNVFSGLILLIALAVDFLSQQRAGKVKTV